MTATMKFVVIVLGSLWILAALVFSVALAKAGSKRITPLRNETELTMPEMRKAKARLAKAKSKQLTQTAGA